MRTSKTRLFLASHGLYYVTRFRAVTRMQLESCAATCVENPRVGGSIPPQATTIQGVARESGLRFSVGRLSPVSSWAGAAMGPFLLGLSQARRFRAVSE